MGVHNGKAARRNWVFPVLISVIAAMLIALVLLADGEGSQPPDTVTGSEPETVVEDAPSEVEGPTQPDLSSAERRDPDDLLATGPADAPVALVVFSDYQCPYCARWSHETLPLMLDYVEAGDLRIEWRDVNVFGEDSERAARASHAAARQGEFWAYHDALFAEGEKRSGAELGAEPLLELAGELGLDTEQFATDMNSPETAERIAENAELGLDLGVYSTPVFLMNGQSIVGAQPSEVFLGAFEQALAGTK